MTDESAGSLTSDLVISEGGWDPRWARVLLIGEHDGLAVVLVDGNGDGAELELEYWARAGGRWTGGATSGHGPLSRLGPAEAWTTGSHVVALGKAAPGARVRLSYAGEAHWCRANEFGIWGFIAAADPGSPGELPAVAPAPG